MAARLPLLLVCLALGRAALVLQKGPVRPSRFATKITTPKAYTPLM